MRRFTESVTADNAATSLDESDPFDIFVQYSAPGADFVARAGDLAVDANG